MAWRRNDGRRAAGRYNGPVLALAMHAGIRQAVGDITSCIQPAKLAVACAVDAQAMGRAYAAAVLAQHCWLVGFGLAVCEPVSTLVVRCGGGDAQRDVRSGCDFQKVFRYTVVEGFFAVTVAPPKRATESPMTTAPPSRRGVKGGWLVTLYQEAGVKEKQRNFW